MSNYNRVFSGQIFFDGDQNSSCFLLPQKSSRLKPEGKRNRPKGAEAPGREVAGYVTAAQVREIAEAKMKDLSANDVEAAMQIVLGSARSMGIEVK